MKKDIFIDNNIASRYFSNPVDAEHSKLVDWLRTFNEDEETDAYLLISPYLMREYHESNRNATSTTNIVQIIGDLTKQERLVNFTKKEIEAFQNQHYSKKVMKRLLSNNKDRNHIPVVLLSDRKMALSEDDNFLHDLYEFSGFEPVTAKRPENLNYKD